MRAHRVPCPAMTLFDFRGAQAELGRWWYTKRLRLRTEWRSYDFEAGFVIVIRNGWGTARVVRSCISYDVVSSMLHAPPRADQ